MLKPPKPGETRTEAQLREHYEVERQLSDQLRNASKDERRTLYAHVYNELFRLVPHHSMLTRKNTPEQQQKTTQNQMLLLRKLLNKEMSLLEIGAGDCSLSFEAAKITKQVYAIEVSQTIADAAKTPANFKLIISDGTTIPLPKNSADVAYSNQLMEHLHPDDAFEQLENIYRTLAQKGVYLCITPNRLNGPHDISQYFDIEATGFHLKEYTVTDLSDLFRKAGFSKVKIFVGAKGMFFLIPVFPVRLLESILKRLPTKISKRLADIKIIRALIDIRLVGIK